MLSSPTTTRSAATSAAGSARRSRQICSVVTLASRSGRYGGPFDVVLQQSALLAAAGNKVQLIAGHLPGDAPGHDGRFTSQWVRVNRWLPTRDFTALLSLRMLAGLWRAVGSADIVHVAFARELIPIAAVVIALLRRRAVVLQPHGMLTSRDSAALQMLDRVVRLLLMRSNALMALTEVEQRDLEARYPEVRGRVVVTGNPVPFDDTQAEHLRAERAHAECTAVFIARLHPRKRVLDFAAAAAVAAEAEWTEQYEVIGPDQGDLASLTEQALTNPRLTYEGAIDGDAVPQRLARAGIFVLPAEAEPWGNVLAMAVTLGVPCVIAASSALASRLSPLPFVRIFKDGDAREMAEAVHQLLTDPPVITPVTWFSRERVLERLLVAYDQALASIPPTRP